MTLSERQAEFTHNAAILIIYIFGTGYRCTLGEAMRSPEQAEIYAKEGKGIKDSLHCKRLAIDINIFTKDGQYITDSKEYEKFGSFWEKLHSANEWGGRWVHRPDGNHFQMREK